MVTDFLCGNNRLIKAFRYFLKREENKPTNAYGYITYGPYNSEYYTYEKDLTATKNIIFYEWSSLDGTKRFFKNLKEFYDFLKECKIEIPPIHMRTKMEKMDIIFSICAPGKNQIVIGDTKKELVDDLKKIADEQAKK